MSPQGPLARSEIPWRQVSSRSVYANKWMSVREDLVTLPDGRTTIYGVVSCGQCVGLLPLLDRDTVLLVRQYRYVAGRPTWEMPTGGVHPGETLEQAAQRELAEETGHRARRLRHLSTYHTSKSVVDEVAHLFLADGLQKAETAPDDTEFIDVRSFAFDTVLRMVLEGEIVDSMTVIAVLLAARRRETRVGTGAAERPRRGPVAEGLCARRTAGGRRAVGMILAALAGCLMVSPVSAADERFPRVEHPVAPIISPAYSTEAERDHHREAERVLNRLRVHPGMRVADIGAGDGYYTVRLARRLGPGATIYAEDVSEPFLARLAGRLAREEISSVTLVHGTAADPRLLARSIDFAILAHVYHEIEQPYEFMYRLHAALQPAGRVAIIDLDRPTPEHGIPPALLRCELTAVGYRRIDFVSLAPADGYLAVFAPPKTLPQPEDIRPCPG